MWDATEDEDQESQDDESDPEYQAELRQAVQGGEPMSWTRKANKAAFKKEGIKEGDYVYGPDVQGVFHGSGVYLDLEEEGLEEEPEWTNAHLRESAARSSLLRCRKISSSTFFSKGKLNELGLFIKEAGNINVVYINSSLTSI